MGLGLGLNVSGFIDRCYVWILDLFQRIMYGISLVYEWNLFYAGSHRDIPRMMVSALTLPGKAYGIIERLRDHRSAGPSRLVRTALS